MSGPEPDELRSWAERRGLAFAPEDTLPPVTERLRRGLGVGERRSSLRTVSDRGLVVTGDRSKRPERQTLGVCQGQLPGGLQGKIGHHVYLSDHGRVQSEGDDRFIATASTVVYAELPLRARPVFHLEARQAGQDMKVGFEIGGSGPDELESPVDGVVPAPHGVEEAGGLRWSSFPAEPAERLRRIGSGSTRFLDGLPVDRIAVEYECGQLAVWVKGNTLTDPGALDQLCRFASTLAADLSAVTDEAPALALDAPLPLPDPDARDRWVAAGADLIEWKQPPVSVVAAQERYKQEVKAQATRTGWKVYAIVAGAVFVFSVLIALASLGVSLLTDELPLGLGLVIAVMSVAGGALAANKIALEAGQGAMRDRIESSAIPWGLEAFARGYAEKAGLVRESPDELRRRLEVPFNGRPQVAWQGELAPGVPGHLSGWIDATGTPLPPRFFLLAVTAESGKPVPGGFECLERDGLRLVWQEVTSVDRAARHLDRLREAATR